MKNFFSLLLIGCAVGLAIKYGALELYTVPTPSMEPTILRGSKVWLNKLVWHFDRGDVIGFERQGESFVKRIVGVPGDSIHSDGAVFSLYKSQVERPWPQNHVFFRVPSAGETIVLTNDNFDFYQPLIEHNEGVSAGRLFDQFYVNGQPTNHYRFQLNYYFVLGDNPSVSEDSRHFGLIGTNQIRGKILGLSAPKNGRTSFATTESTH